MAGPGPSLATAHMQETAPRNPELDEATAIVLDADPDACVVTRRLIDFLQTFPEGTRVRVARGLVAWAGTRDHPGRSISHALANGYAKRRATTYAPRVQRELPDELDIHQRAEQEIGRRLKMVSAAAQRDCPQCSGTGLERITGDHNNPFTTDPVAKARIRRLARGALLWSSAPQGRWAGVFNHHFACPCTGITSIPPMSWRNR